MEGSNTRTTDQRSTSTTTTEQVPIKHSDAAEGSSNGTLRLRGAPMERRRVTWTEEVVDNEGLDRKKTKICCIYNKPREFGESSSEESDSSSSSDEDDDHQSVGNGSLSGNGHQNTEQRGIHSCRTHKRNGQQRRKNAYEKPPNGQRPKA